MGSEYSLREHINAVKEFESKCNNQLPDKPTMPDEKTRKLRAILILEEALETVHALGFSVVKYPEDIDSTIDQISSTDDIVLEPNFQEDLAKIVDGCADNMWVGVTGTLLCCGVDVPAVLEEVDKSNLSKFRDGYYFREDGKLIKSPQYDEANFKKFVE